MTIQTAGKGNVYIKDAMIVTLSVLLANGVAHIIDQEGRLPFQWLGEVRSIYPALALQAHLLHPRVTSAMISFALTINLPSYMPLAVCCKHRVEHLTISKRRSANSARRNNYELQRDSVHHDEQHPIHDESHQGQWQQGRCQIRRSSAKTSRHIRPL